MIRQTWKMAISAVFANKLRTFLTMLGVIIGVAALIILVSIADGATTSVSDRISSMGSSYLMVRVTDDKENPIRLSELSELFEEESIGEYAPYGRTSATGKSGYHRRNHDGIWHDGLLFLHHESGTGSRKIFEKTGCG